MEKKLVNIITEQTDILFDNILITLDIITEEQVDKLFSDMPLWKHLYHMLHSIDQWFINPNKYNNPDFHIAEMNSLYTKSENKLSLKELKNYYALIKAKTYKYLEQLNDEDLGKEPQACKFSRLALILAQYRHLAYHIGSIHSFMLYETGKWPKFIGISK